MAAAGGGGAEEGADAEVAMAERGEIRVQPWSGTFPSRSHSGPATPRSRPASPRTSPAFIKGSPFAPSKTRFLDSRASSASPIFSAAASFSAFSVFMWEGWKLLAGFGGRGRSSGSLKQAYARGKRKPTGGIWRRKRTRGLVAVIGLVGLFFLMNWWMLSRLQESGLDHHERLLNQSSSSSSIQGEWSKFKKGKRPQRFMYARLLALAAHALAENDDKPEPQDLWEEPRVPTSIWKPCAHQSNWEGSGSANGKNGYILVSANGGISQQRVAVCNAVAVARLLNSTLVLPKFLFSSVWRDESQFGDIYQEEHFINYLRADIPVVKELPSELLSLDLEAIGSLVTDDEIMKEAKTSFYLKNILPILLQNKVVHFVGFGNRLAFDPIPFQLQKLRCRCNFHALMFVPKIQETGALLVKRMRQKLPRWRPVDHNLVGPFAVESSTKKHQDIEGSASRYLALHLRFEMDMAAYSMCYFGGGEEEREELEAYRATHFPMLTLLKKSTKLPSAAALRSEGKCPLTPEEAVLMLAALGFNRKTHIYIAGARIYGGKSRMAALMSLYPNLVTKENLLTASEIAPFHNFSSQLAALDFIGCAAADSFAMTDSGSQLSSLVAGFRMYYGGGQLPTIRPNKRRLAGIFSKNATIEWEELEGRVRKAVKESKRVQERPIARSIYRHPRCLECMCRTE